MERVCSVGKERLLAHYKGAKVRWCQWSPDAVGIGVPCRGCVFPNSHFSWVYNVCLPNGSDPDNFDSWSITSRVLTMPAQLCEHAWEPLVHYGGITASDISCLSLLEPHGLALCPAPLLLECITLSSGDKWWKIVAIILTTPHSMANIWKELPSKGHPQF